jgi:hypothetical protein
MKVRRRYGRESSIGVSVNSGEENLDENPHVEKDHKRSAQEFRGIPKEREISICSVGRTLYSCEQAPARTDE